MQKLPLIAIEVAIGFLVPVAWAVRELLILRREKRLDAEKARQADKASPDDNAPNAQTTDSARAP